MEIIDRMNTIQRIAKEYIIQVMIDGQKYRKWDYFSQSN